MNSHNRFSLLKCDHRDAGSALAGGGAELGLSELLEASYTSRNRFLIVASTARTRCSGHKLKYRKFHLNNRKKMFYGNITAITHFEALVNFCVGVAYSIICENCSLIEFLPA